jgi:hypothetical protein
MNLIAQRYEEAAASDDPLVGFIMTVLAQADTPLSSYNIASQIPGYPTHEVKYSISALRHVGRIKPCRSYGSGYANPPVEYELYLIANPLEKLAYL